MMWQYGCIYIMAMMWQCGCIYIMAMMWQCGCIYITAVLCYDVAHNDAAMWLYPYMYITVVLCYMMCMMLRLWACVGNSLFNVLWNLTNVPPKGIHSNDNAPYYQVDITVSKQTIIIHTALRDHPPHS